MFHRRLSDVSGSVSVSYLCLCLCRALIYLNVVFVSVSLSCPCLFVLCPCLFVYRVRVCLCLFMVRVCLCMVTVSVCVSCPCLFICRARFCFYVRELSPNGSSPGHFLNKILHRTVRALETFLNKILICLQVIKYIINTLQLLYVVVARLFIFKAARTR